MEAIFNLHGGGRQRLRQEDRDGRAFPLGARDLYLAAVQEDDLLNDGQSQSGPS